MSMRTVLIVDDNHQITAILADYAKKEGFSPIIAKDGEDALHQFTTHKPDIILLDVMMPKLNGFDVCKEIRKTSNTPIIMITARGEDFEKIMGLDIGADDYIVKPFTPSEVMARIRAILRRIQPTEQEGSEALLVLDNLLIDMNEYRVSINNNSDILLTKKEFELLWTLASNHNKVFSRENLLDSIWGYEYYGDNRTVDSHIKRLRAKLDNYPHPNWEIKTIWGVGYKLEVQHDDKK